MVSAVPLNASASTPQTTTHMESDQLVEFLELDLIRAFYQDGNQESGLEELEDERPHAEMDE